MYLGQDRDELYAHLSHPYTKALLSAVPVPEPGAATKRVVLEGDVPVTRRPCRPGAELMELFHPRCPEKAAHRFTQTVPQLVDLGDGHQMACLLRYPEDVAQ